MARPWCVLVFFCACAAAQSVDGTVINAVTNFGIGGLKVDVFQGGTILSATTDNQGKFHLENLKDGSWTVQCLSTGYGSRPARFTVANGTSAKVELKLTPTPHLTGRVLDDSKSPVPKATIILLSPVFSYVGATDDTGKFDLHESLPPGEYILSATAPPGLRLPDPGKDSGRVLAWAHTYYPASLLPEGAAKLSLKPGTDVLGLELKLLAVPTHTIKGVCLNPNGSPAQNVKITRTEGRPYPIAETVTTNAEGAWEFAAVVDGEWNLGAQSSELQASEWIEMGGHDVERVTLRLTAPFAVTSKVEIEAPQTMTVPRMPSISLTPHFSRSGMGTALILLGTLRMDKLYPGLYSISAPRPPQPFYLDAIRVDGIEPNTREIELSGPATITAVYKINGGQVRGTVEGCTEGSVWLIPQDAAKRHAFWHAEPCLKDGHYEAKSIRPGEYYAVPASGEFPRAWIYGIFEQPVLDRATKVTVRAGETTSLDLRLY
jgi:hypothetical protein